MKFANGAARVFLAAVIAAFAVMPSAIAETSSVPKPPTVFPAPVSGDYAIYRDYSWKSPTWVGFLYYDDFTYGAVAVTPSLGRNVSVLFRVEPLDGKIILTGQNIISKITPNDVEMVNYLMSLLPDLYSWHGAASGLLPAVTPGSTRSLLLPPVVTQKMNVTEFGGDVVLTWAPEVPLFNLRDMKTSGGEAVFSLDRYGRVRAGEDTAFFAFTPAEPARDGKSFVLPATRKSESRVVEGVTLKLDDQWTMIADNTFFLGDQAVLIVDTIDLAAAGLDRDNLPLSLVRLFSLSGKTSWAVPSSLAVSGNANRFRIENLFYDSTTGRANRDIKVCIPHANNTCTVISLSVADSAWQSQRSYFESLF